MGRGLGDPGTEAAFLWPPPAPLSSTASPTPTLAGPPASAGLLAARRIFSKKPDPADPRADFSPPPSAPRADCACAGGCCHPGRVSRRGRASPAEG